MVEIPKQEKQEGLNKYILRACSIMEKTQKTGDGARTTAKLTEEAAEKKDRMERLESNLL